VGIIANAQFAQMADFALGWAGIDFAGDDGRKFGLWPWQMDAASNGPPRRGPPEPRRREPAPARRGRDKETPPHLDPRLQGLP